jgi:hypothetical protein
VCVQTLTEMPTSFPLGTTLEYTRANPDFPASQGWTSQLAIQGAKKVVVAGSASSDNHVFSVPATAGGSGNSTDDLTAGVYQWAEYYTKAGKTYPGATGWVTVQPNLVSATEGTLENEVQQELNLVEARIRERLGAGHDHESRQIDSFSTVLISLKDLVAHRGVLREQLRSIAAGGQFSRQVLVQFSGLGLRS